MLTIKNQVRNSRLFGLIFLTVALFLTACSPPGPRALLDGKRSLDRGDYAAALVTLSNAVALIPTNALAWHYYGLAAQQNRHFPEAERAYSRALTLDRDLIEARFNLGCLYLETDRAEEAKTQLTAYNLRVGNTVPGLTKAGTAHLRLKEYSSAEKAFTEALKIEPKNPDALNGLGLVKLQRGRPAEAAQAFAAAVQASPKYKPALLNLAVTRHQYLHDRSGAVQAYRDFLTTGPSPAENAAVSAILRQLDQEQTPTPRVTQPAPATSLVAQATSNATSRPVSASTPPPNPIVANTRPQTLPQTSNVSVSAPRSNPAVTVAPAARSGPSPVNQNAPVTNQSAPRTVEVVKLPPEPVVKVANDNPSPVKPETREQTEPTRTQGSSSNLTAQVQTGTTSPKSEKRGFFEKINPLNLFTKDTKGKSVTPLQAPRPKQDARYGYKYPARPAAGNRAQAQPLFAQGVQAQASGQAANAAEFYRQAIELDPSYFEARYNLGLALTQLGNLPEALSAYEYAIAIKPNSADARFNFALTLSQAGYVVDSAQELETLLRSYPNEVRAHLACGNIYAQHLRQPSRARPHYTKVLELDPRHSQASAIRRWLNDNP